MIRDYAPMSVKTSGFSTDLSKGMAFPPKHPSCKAWGKGGKK